MRHRLTEADRRRIGAVFEEHRGFIEAVAIRHAGVDQAPDVVAEVGVRLCQSLNGLRARDAIRTWIYRVTVSAAHDLHRDQARLARARAQLETLTSPHESVVEPDEYLRDQQRRDAFMEALNRLKSRDKTLICNMCALDDVSGTSSADRVALHRARQRLREQLLRDPRLRHT
jgi:RNA polymerase sigma factor (sigma-70 family)